MQFFAHPPTSEHFLGPTTTPRLPQAFWNSIAHAKPMAVGLNCALGASDMKKYIDNLSACADCYVFCYPNAGLPNAMGGYDQKGVEMAEEVRPFFAEGLVNGVGGCCGTTPEHIAAIRAVEPSATFRSSFIIGYPGETEADHDALLEFLDAADLDWVGFFSFSNEDGTYAADLGDHVAPELVAERLKEASERQDAITEAKREAMLGHVVSVLVDDIAEARSKKEAPEIDGIIEVPDWLEVGNYYDVTITQSLGTDLVGEPVENHR